MKLAALGFLLACGGCSLYFGDAGSPTPGTPGNEGDPGTQPGGPIQGDPGTLPPPVDPGPVDPGAARCEGPQVDVFAVYVPRTGNSSTGEAGVTIEQPGVHTLVLSAYERTSWHVSLAPGASVNAVYLYGYHAQTVDVGGVPVVTHSYDQDGQFACGYSFPYNGQGCDTNQLLARVAAEAGPVHDFHGCYQAVKWTLHTGGRVTSDCDTAAGYEQDDFTRACRQPSDWQPGAFQTLDPATCTGARFVRYDARYAAWVGAILCGRADRYKLYMSEQRDDRFLQIADFAGDGQDHCELVNPAFTIPDEDDITSGGCTACSVGQLIDVDGPPVYARARFGQPFERVTSRYWADLTTDVYACGIAIGGGQ